MILKNSANIKEQCSSYLVIETLLFTSIAKRLTWESSGKYVKCRYVFRLNLLYVTFWYFTKICLIRFLCELVVIRRKDTLYVVVFHRKTETTNATKQIYTFIFLL